VTELHPSHWRITGPLPADHQVSFSMNWDPGWTATQDGQPIPVQPNLLGLITLIPRTASSGTIDVIYSGTTQQKFFGLISFLAWVVSIGLCIRSRSWRGSTSMPSS
jgi:hypothetical protein